MVKAVGEFLVTSTVGAQHYPLTNSNKLDVSSLCDQVSFVNH